MNEKLKLSDYVACFAGLLTLGLFILKLTFAPGIPSAVVVSPLWVPYGLAIITAIPLYCFNKRQADQVKAQAEFMKRFEPKEKSSLWARRMAEMKHVTGYHWNGKDTLERLRQANPERCKAFGHTVEEMGPLFWAVATAGECGEMCNLIKKKYRGDVMPDFIIDLSKEVADQIIYLDLLCKFYNINMEESVIQKFNEVSDRVCSPIKL